MINEHEPEKKLPCPTCGKLFGLPKWLKDHENAVHLNIKRHYCPHCPHAEYFKGSMQKHIAQVHKKIKPFQCPHCGKRFGDAGPYKYHHTRCGTNTLQRIHGNKSDQSTEQTIL